MGWELPLWPLRTHYSMFPVLGVTAIKPLAHLQAPRPDLGRPYQIGISFAHHHQLKHLYFQH